MQLYMLTQFLNIKHYKIINSKLCHILPILFLHRQEKNEFKNTNIFFFHIGIEVFMEFFFFCRDIFLVHRYFIFPRNIRYTYFVWGGINFVFFHLERVKKFNNFFIEICTLR